eukprot:SAG31_NODE_211_length_20274_cov_40.333482_15_plen_55_part_00
MLTCAFGICFNTYEQLWHCTADEIDVRKLREEIERMDGVKKLHSLRLWKPDDQR